MASFTAFLEVGGKRYPLYRYELYVRQEVDELGRPASPVLGGTITCTLTIPADQDSFLYQWMLSPTMQQDGKVRLLQASSKATEKTISFFNAYCTGLDISFLPGQGGGASSRAGSSQVQLQISPQRIALGAVVHDNNWPLESHGSGESFVSQTSTDSKLNKKEEEPSAFMEGLHTVLDVVGMIPVLGEVADSANAAIYLTEGRYGEAALSAASMIPLAGNAVGAAKLSKRAVKLAKLGKGLKSSKVTRALTRFEKTVLSKLNKIAKHRKLEWLPEYAPSPGITGTVAHSRINGKDYYGYNSKIDDSFPKSDGSKRYSLSVEERRGLFDEMKADLHPTRDLSQAQFLSHAEAENLIKASKDGKLPKTIDMYVDRPTCPNSRKNLPILMKKLGVKKLNIFYTVKDHPGFTHLPIELP